MSRFLLPNYAWWLSMMALKIIIFYFFSGMSVNAVNEKFHHSAHCWVIQEQDVTSLIFNSL